MSIGDFVTNIRTGNNLEQMADILLSYELLLIEKLNFQLVIHTAYRPFEGLIIDLKVKIICQIQEKSHRCFEISDTLFT